MKLNPRHYIVQEARSDFSRVWLSFLDRHEDLTSAEVLNILSGELQTFTNIVVQQEWKEARREQRESESRGQADDRGGETS